MIANHTLEFNVLINLAYKKRLMGLINKVSNQEFDAFFIQCQKLVKPYMYTRCYIVKYFYTHFWWDKCLNYFLAHTIRHVLYDSIVKKLLKKTVHILPIPKLHKIQMYILLNVIDCSNSIIWKMPEEVRRSRKILSFHAHLHIFLTWKK